MHTASRQLCVPPLIRPFVFCEGLNVIHQEMLSTSLPPPMACAIQATFLHAWSTMTSSSALATDRHQRTSRGALSLLRRSGLQVLQSFFSDFADCALSLQIVNCALLHCPATIDSRSNGAVFLCFELRQQSCRYKPHGRSLHQRGGTSIYTRG